MLLMTFIIHPWGILMELNKDLDERKELLKQLLSSLFGQDKGE